MIVKDYYELLDHGIKALNFGTRQNQEYILNEIWKICTPIERDEVYKEIQKQSLTNNNFVTYDTSILSNVDIFLNLKLYCNKLWQKIQKEQTEIQFPSFTAINFLYSNDFYQTQEPFYKSLNVSTLLNAIKYGLNIVNIIFDADTEEAENYITVLEGLDKIFNNNKPQNLLKDLGYTLDVFYKIQNHFENNTERKREKKIEVLAVNLFIEFLTQ